MSLRTSNEPLWVTPPYSSNEFSGLPYWPSSLLASSSLHGSSAEGILSLEPNAMLSLPTSMQWLACPWKNCYSCGSNDTFLWSCIAGIFYCQLCSASRLHHRYLEHRGRCKDAIVVPAFSKLHVLKPSGIEWYDSGGPVERFLNIEPVMFPTQYRHALDDLNVVVTGSSLLEVAAASSEGAVILWGDTTSTMHTVSTFWMAVEKSIDTEDLKTTEILYVPDVVIFGHVHGSELKILTKDLVYSKQRSDDCMLQMLRLCSERGRDELVIESTGLGTSARFLYDVFFDEASDVVGNFRKVSFAQCTSNVAEDLRHFFCTAYVGRAPTAFRVMSFHIGINDHHLRMQSLYMVSLRMQL